MILKIFTEHLNRIKNNLLVFFLILIVSSVSLYTGYIHHEMKHAVAYLFIVWLCSLIIDAFVLWKPLAGEFPVRKPKKELVFLFACIALGFLSLYIRFNGPVKWADIQGLKRLFAGLGMIIFVFPVGMSLGMLLFRYKLSELGIRFQGFWCVLPVIFVFFITSRIISPDSFTWSEIYKAEGGVFMTFFTGIVSAGLSEEFFKMTVQSRLGAVLGNKGMGWFITTLIWASLHIPKWYGEDGDAKEAILGAIRIVPIGLLWGYMSIRTKSILPATLVHGTNFWGMQNF